MCNFCSLLLQISFSYIFYVQFLFASASDFVLLHLQLAIFCLLLLQNFVFPHSPAIFCALRHQNFVFNSHHSNFLVALLQNFVCILLPQIACSVFSFFPVQVIKSFLKYSNPFTLHSYTSACASLAIPFCPICRTSLQENNSFWRGIVASHQPSYRGSHHDTRLHWDSSLPHVPE